MRKRLIALVATMFVLTAVGCDEGGDEPAAQADPGVASASESDEPMEDPSEVVEEKDSDEAAASAEFEYPNYDLESLTSVQRSELAGVAGAELCPCPDAVVSLHECMQREDRCEDADEMAGVLVEALSEGGEAEEAFERVAQDRGSQAREHQFHLADSPYKGNPDASVVIVEFADFQCGHCAMAAEEMRKLAERFGDDVVIYFKFFPLGSPLSDQAARAAAAAHEQGRFWQMHDLLFANQRSLNSSRIQGFARQLGMNYERFERDMSEADVQRNVLRDRQEGMAAGVQGTPSFFINGQRYTGTPSAEAIGANVRSLLQE